jgi:hypothetical protein
MSMTSLQDRERLHLLLLGALIGITLLVASLISSESLADSSAPDAVTVAVSAIEGDEE